MHIGYLACQLTLPDSPNRRFDAFEHDLMVDCLELACDAHGSSFAAHAWDQDGVDWAAYDAVLIGSPWDYQDNLDAFMRRLALIESKTVLFNSSAMVRWNNRKTYLRDLESDGVATIPTLWLEHPTEAEIGNAFEALGSDDLVFKRQIGANAEGQFRLQRGDAAPAMPEPMMAQPFLPSIQSEGELSFVYVDGEFSHALAKSAAAGEYRIQSSYGGTETVYLPNLDDQTTATATLQSLDETPLYARVDMARGDNGELLLMELELIEPFLYPQQGPEFGERMHAALVRRLA